MPGVLEDLVEWFELGTVQREDYGLAVNIYEAAHYIPLLPPRQLTLALTASIEPHQLSAAVIGLAILVITYAIPRQYTYTPVYML